MERADLPEELGTTRNKVTYAINCFRKIWHEEFEALSSKKANAAAKAKAAAK